MSDHELDEADAATRSAATPLTAGAGGAANASDTDSDSSDAGGAAGRAAVPLSAPQQSPAPSPVPTGPAPVAPRKRAGGKPRVPRGKKARLEAAAVGADGVPVERPTMQRSASSRSRRGGVSQTGSADTPLFSRPLSSPQGFYAYTPPDLQVSTSFSSTAAMVPPPLSRRERVVCIVPGSDTMKIGFCEANGPFFVRQVVAYRVPTPAAKSEPTDSANGVAPKSAPADLSVLDAATAESERDEAKLSESDRALLTRWRRKRDADLVAAEKAVAGKKRGGGAAAAARPPPKLVPAAGSIHDADNAMRIVATTANAAAAASAATNEPPRVLCSSEVVGAVPPPSSASYLPRRPFARGAWNLPPGTPLRRVADWTEDLLRGALADHLGIRGSQCGAHAVSLVVPDSWHPCEVGEFVDLLLSRLAFREVFLCRESVAACFGAGLTSACVVDLGAAHTTIVCVEDGLLLPRTRVALNYGGRDIDDVLAAAIADKPFWSERTRLLTDAEARGPADESIVALRLAEQVRVWKERFCYCLKTDDDEPPSTPPPTVASLAYTPHPPAALPASVPNELQLAAAVAPLALFHPSLFPVALHSTADAHRTAVLDAARARDDPHLDALASSPYAPPPAEQPLVFDPVAFDDEVAVGAAHGRKKKKQAEEAAAAAAAAAPPPSASPVKATPPPPPFKLDRRRKDHQALLQNYTEEQLMAGAHLVAEAEAVARTQAAAAAQVQAEKDKEKERARKEVEETQTSSPPASASAGTVETFLAHRQPLHLAVGTALKAVGSLEAQNKLATSILLTGGGCNLPQLLEAFEERSERGNHEHMSTMSIACSREESTVVRRLTFSRFFLVPVPQSGRRDSLPPPRRQHSQLSHPSEGTRLGAAELARCRHPRKGGDDERHGQRRKTPKMDNGCINNIAHTNDQCLMRCLCCSCLFSSQWVTAEEWKRYGTKLFREKAPFTFY